MDKVPKLGQLITDEQERDAIHIAVAPVTAGEILYPGDRIAFTKDGDAFTVVKSNKPLGIVDPFLTDTVKKGKKFYMFLMPNTITGLRHEWTHPAFEHEAALSQYEPTFHKLKGAVEEVRWVTEWAEQIGSDYDEVMEAAEDYLSSGSYLSRGGTFEGVSVPDEFWNKYEIIKRQTVDEDDRGSFFSCSC